MADSLVTKLAAAPKPLASFYDEWKKQKQAKVVAPDTSTFGKYTTGAVDRLAQSASGVPSTALASAVQQSREALARQAGNQRMVTSEAAASSGNLGQGKTLRAVQGTENQIATSLADARAKEIQTLGQAQESANNQLLTMATDERNRTDNTQRASLESMLANGTAAQKLQAQVGLQQLAGIDPGENVDAINEAAYQEQINSPEYQLQQSQAQTALAKSQTEAADYKKEQAYAPFKAKAQGSIENYNGEYVNAFRVKSPVGSIVMVDGKPLQYVGTRNIGKRSIGSGNTVVANAYIFKDPVTGETVEKQETWK